MEITTNKIIGATTLAIGGVYIAGKSIENQMRNQNSNVIKPIDTVSIIVPTYNEEMFVEQSLQSINNQSIIQQYPDYFETILVDSSSKDRTVELAKPYVTKVIHSPRGKLTARNMATDHANGNIIVSVDADAIYPYHWLNTLLEPFNDINNPSYSHNIVAVNGSTLDDSIPGIPLTIRCILEWIEWQIHPNKLLGRNSAYYKHTFYQMGKFDESVNQFNIKTINEEEENGFGEKMANFGDVIIKRNASCVHLGGFKIACRHNPTSENCLQYGIGIERFG